MANPDQTALLALAAQHLYPNYRQAPCVFVRGKGCELWDKAGKRYLDLAAGVAVSSLGHAHPRYVAALSEQVGRLVHMSNYFYNEPNILLASELCRRTGMDRAFFCSTGTEANEALLKRFGPYEGGVTHVAYGDVAAVRRAMGPDVAAIVAEPVQGEGGVVPAPPDFLAELRAIADEAGALLLLDEVQTGIGRTGSFLACQAAGVVPDAIALAKGLGGGFPVGAMLCREHLAGALPPGSHGSTYGGNALASTAALTVLAVLDEENLVEGARKKGNYLSKALSAVCARHPDLVGPERGQGLLRAVPLKAGVEPRSVLAALRERGVLLIVAGDAAIRFCPPLVVTEAELDEGVRTFDDVLASLRRPKDAQIGGAPA